MGDYQPQQPYPPYEPHQQQPGWGPPPPADRGGFGWAVLGFFVPIVGLVLFVVWRESKPRSAKSAGVGALLGFVLVMIAPAAVVLALRAPWNPVVSSEPYSEVYEAPDPTVEATPDAERTKAASQQPVYSGVPDPALAEGREWTGSMETSIGAIKFTLNGAAAPQATANFIQLARDGYYDGSSCHRLTTAGIFVLQCGSLTGDGTDGPGYQFGPLENVPEDGVYPPGVIAMARASAEDSQGAQFFITYEESVIPGGYTVFGRVTSGLDAIEDVAAAGTADGGSDGRPAVDVTFEAIEFD
ncbi:MAG: peptidylprolyl isomerase [Bifidobacteriaceae bacterium]|jgi:peptidyl-prolyl cis-trans isomerase B (cyclophilin B)|nr:peptidylprolyl isomerase [Bifidobacteriaceae bacterium]